MADKCLVVRAQNRSHRSPLLKTSMKRKKLLLVLLISFQLGILLKKRYVYITAEPVLDGCCSDCGKRLITSVNILVKKGIR